MEVLVARRVALAEELEAVAASAEPLVHKHRIRHSDTRCTLCSTAVCVVRTTIGSCQRMA